MPSLHNILLVILSLFVIYFIFTRNKQVKDYSGEKAAYDRLIKVYEVQIADLKAENSQKDKELEQHYRNDSLLLIKQNQVTTKYVQIPKIVYALSNDELQREFSRFDQN